MAPSACKGYRRAPIVFFTLPSRYIPSINDSERTQLLDIFFKHFVTGFRGYTRRHLEKGTGTQMVGVRFILIFLIDWLHTVSCQVQNAKLI